jgi:hypothetical protein
MAENDYRVTPSGLPLAVQALCLAAYSFTKDADDAVTRDAMRLINSARDEPDHATDYLKAAVATIDRAIEVSADDEPDDLIFFAKLRGMAATALSLMSPGAQSSVSKMGAKVDLLEVLRETVLDTACNFYEVASTARAVELLVENGNESNDYFPDAALLLRRLGVQANKWAEQMDMVEILKQECAA